MLFQWNETVKFWIHIDKNIWDLTLAALTNETSSATLSIKLHF